MQTETGMIMAVAIFHNTIVTYLPTQSVASVFTCFDVPHRDAIAILQKNTARMVTVKIFIVPFVPVENDIVDQNVGHMFASKKREQRRSSRLSHSPDIFPKWSVELEPLTTASYQRPFKYY